MKPYLVKGIIKELGYMADSELTTKEYRIVMANNINEALEKYEKYWESKNVEYGVSYRIGQVYIEETIL